MLADSHGLRGLGRVAWHSGLEEVKLVRAITQSYTSVMHCTALMP